MSKGSVEELELDPYENEIENDDLILIAHSMKDSMRVTSLVVRNVETEARRDSLSLAPIFREGDSIRSVHLEDSGEVGQL